MQSRFTKLLASAGTLALLGTAGIAHAVGTAAGTDVDNTFTLDYKVGSVQQTQIDNTATPTDFTVDRVVDLTVVANPASQTANPGETGVTQVFTVTNDSNAFVAYDLDLVNDTGDQFDLTGASVTYELSTDGGASFTSFSYTPGSGDEPSVDIAPDAIVRVTVTSNVPAGQSDGDVANLVLVADSLEPTAANGVGGTAGDQIAADTGANGEDTVETVLNDAAGTTGVTGVTDGAGDGAGSALSAVTVEAAAITALKEVTLVDPDTTTDAACAGATAPSSPTNGDYYVPGACIEYTITVSNTGSQAATAVVLRDTLSEFLTFVSTSNDMSGSTASGDTSDVGGSAVSGNAPAQGTSCDGTTSTCEVRMVQGSVPAGSVATPTTRVLRIRARVK